MLHPSRVRGDSFKHKVGVKKVPVIAAVGNGRIRVWEYHDGKFGAMEYSQYLQAYIEPAVIE